jgi:hypothetical protein
MSITSWFKALTKIAMPRTAAAAGSLLLLGIFAGCTGIQLMDNRGPAPTVEQGEIPVPPGKEISIYYSAPFASVPELVTFWSDQCVVTEQKEDHFTVRNNGGTVHKLSWRARGLAALTLGRGPQVIPGGTSQPDLSHSPTAESTAPVTAPPTPPVTLGTPR